MLERKSKQFSKKGKPAAALDRSISAADRHSQKKAFSEIWLRESTYYKYRYNVETCDDGTQIYLMRPTRSHGLDFEVRVKGFKSTTRKSKSERPSHDDVAHDLKSKLRTRPDLREELFASICDVYDCKDPKEIVTQRPRVTELTAGLPIDQILRIIKWLFIEQDMTYWLGTGRNMLMCGIENIFGLKTHLFVEEMPKQTCSHRNWAPREILERLHRTQGGTGRHKCAVCAFAQGYLAGQEQPLPPGGNSECTHGRRAPTELLDSLPNSQAGAGRHKCAICAYHQGFATTRTGAT